ncbi:MAG: hypothetical protein ABIW47_00745 [Ginsengibacter sp.]|jgi:hypothetical protein
MIHWYQARTAKVQLLLAFGVYFIFWLGVLLIRHHWFERQSDSPLKLVSESVFMAFFITLFFEWKKVKMVFKKKG